MKTVKVDYNVQVPSERRTEVFNEVQSILWGSVPADIQSQGNIKAIETIIDTVVSSKNDEWREYVTIIAEDINVEVKL